MNNNFQGYVQPNGYNQYGMPYVNPLDLEKKNDKKILRTMGNLFGGAVILYIVASFVSAFALMFLGNFFPSVNLIFENQLMSDAYGAMGSILFIGVSFLIAHLVLRSKKYVGVLPLGTTYNRKAAAYLVMMMLPIILVTSMVVNYISFSVQESAGITFSSGMEDMQVVGASQVIMNIIAMAITPAIIEEIAIRGIILEPLRRYGDKFAIVASALIFSLLHGNMVQIPYTLFAGIYFGYVAVKTGSLWPSIILHFFNNLFSTVIIAADSNFGEMASSILALLMLLVIIIVGIFGGIKYSSMRYRVEFKKGVTTLKLGEKISALFWNVPMVFAVIIMLILTATSVTFNG